MRDEPDPAALPTLRDVARHAGVSLATADRVVNRRPGVTPRTIERVETAVRELGFERHAGAADLARRVRFRIVAILPRGTNPFVAMLKRELAQASSRMGVRRIELDFVEADSFLPDRLAETLLIVSARADGIVLMGLDDPLVRAAIDEAAAAGVPVVALVSDVPGSRRHRYVGIDNRAAGRVAASLIGRFAGKQSRPVAVLLGSRGLRDHRDRLDGFQEALAERYGDLDLAGVVEGNDDADDTREAMRRLLAKVPDLAAIYSAGAGNTGLAAALAEHDARPVVVAHELTPETRPLLEGGTIDALIVQDVGHEARSALRVLMSALTGTRIDEDQERIRIEILLSDNLPT